MSTLIERYQSKIRGVISCYDRVIIKGTLPGFCYAEGMTSYLKFKEIRIFDYPSFAEPLRNQIRENAEKLAKDNGIEIEFVRKLHSFRKEDRIHQILAHKGPQTGLVHIFSAMETCDTYQPWHNKKTHQTYLKKDIAKCLHYYFYFIDSILGLCYLRVPTWCPFSLQFYFNGHNLLARKLKKNGIAYELADNAFTSISNWPKAQQLSDDLSVAQIHRVLDHYAKQYCPVIQSLQSSYHWSLMQVEYSTDIVFNKKEDLHVPYEILSRSAIHAVKADDVATFLGRKLHPLYQDEVGTQFNTRIEGTRIRHRMGAASIKMYDKFGLILRIETTTNDVSFFKHHRMVEQRDGHTCFKLANLKKSIYSLAPDLMKHLLHSNTRYLAFLSDLDDPSAGILALNKISDPVHSGGRSYKGYNLFLKDDLALFKTLVRGEYNISGFRNSHIHSHLDKTTSQISYLLKRLRLHGLIKKVTRTYKYFLTAFGRHVVLTALKLKELFIIPSLARSFTDA